MPAAEQVTDPLAYHGEGAVWYDGWGGLRFVDMLAGDILSVSDGGEVTRLETGSRVAAMIRPRVDGGFVVATENRFALWNETEEVWRSSDLWEGGRRFNEGGCTPDGTVLCGSLSDDRTEGSGDLWMLGTDRSASPVLSGVTISNGVGFTKDGTRMYYVDSRTRRIDVIDYSDGRLGARRTHVQIGEGLGNPDGLWVDAEDGVWVALYGGSAVHRYDNAGSLTDVVDLPVTNVTSCTLGGADLRTLYVTTSRENLPDDEQPLAGAVFAAEVEVSGLPVLLADL